MTGSPWPALTLHRSRGHIRIDADGQCALTCADLGSRLHIWQTIGGLHLNREQVREFAKMLTEWSERE